MADILIKGMEMPKCCDECPMSQLINDNQYAYCNLLRKGTKAGYILKACPLVEIPPHGRLVDADILLADHPKTANWDYMVLECIIRNAPTVVEANR